MAGARWLEPAHAGREELAVGGGEARRIPFEEAEGIDLHHAVMRQRPGLARHHDLLVGRLAVPFDHVAPHAVGLAREAGLRHRPEQQELVARGAAAVEPHAGEPVGGVAELRSAEQAARADIHAHPADGQLGVAAGAEHLAQLRGEVELHHLERVDRAGIDGRIGLTRIGARIHQLVAEADRPRVPLAEDLRAQGEHRVVFRPGAAILPVDRIDPAAHHGVERDIAHAVDRVSLGDGGRIERDLAWLGPIELRAERSRGDEGKQSREAAEAATGELAGEGHGRGTPVGDEHRDARRGPITARGHARARGAKRTRGGEFGPDRTPAPINQRPSL